MYSKIIDLADIDEWKKYSNKLPLSQRDIYYTPEYYKLYEENGEGRALCFIFEDGQDCAIYPFLINPINLSFLKELECKYYDIQGAYGYNGVATSSNDKYFIDRFYESFNAFCKERNIIVEFTRFHPLLNNQFFSKDYLEIHFNRKTVFLDLKPGYENIWNNSYNGITRNMIRKAAKSGFNTEITQNSETLQKFHGLYTKTMTNINAEHYYFFPKKYFIDFGNLIGKYQYIVNVLYQEKTIASLILMINGLYAHYHLAARQISNAPAGASNYALDTAIKLAIELKCSSFHFGGGTTSGEDDSLFKFKAGYSKQKADFFIGYKIHNSDIYNLICEAWHKNSPDNNDRRVLKYRY